MKWWLKKIAKGAFLTGYNGKRIYLKDDKGSRYLVKINGTQLVDGNDTTRCIDGDPANCTFEPKKVGAYGNDISFNKIYPANLNNSSLVYIDDQIFVKADRTIMAGEEIFINYRL